MSESLRFWSMIAVLSAATISFHLVSHGEPVMPSHPLANLPMAMGTWSGHELPIAKRIIDAVGVDDYVSRFYAQPEGPPVLLYIGYYKSQRTGETIHSPKNCLPGAGWQPVSAGKIQVPLPDGQRAWVNLYTIEKGLDRQVVLYWYQSHGRIIASEYWAKIYMVLDAIHLNRTDSALVRVSTVLGPDKQSADARLIAFAQQTIANTKDLSPR
jgi:EpsI family protein